GCCTPGSVAPMVALAPVVSGFVTLPFAVLLSVGTVVRVPVVAFACGAGCCVPGLGAPTVGLAAWLAIWSLSIGEAGRVAVAALGLGGGTPGSLGPMVAFGLSVTPSCCCNVCTSAAQVPAALAAPAASRRLAPIPNASAALCVMKYSPLLSAASSA